MPEEKSCLFCNIWSSRVDVIMSSKSFYAQLDKFPISPGHAEVIPKRHVVSLFDLTEEEWQELMPMLRDTVTNIKMRDLKAIYTQWAQHPLNEKSRELCQEMLKHPGLERTPDAYNFGNNDGEAAGRTIHHLHWHIIPRFKGDVPDPRGGIRNIIPQYGNYTK